MRVGAIVIQYNQVALIERLREDETLCHLFPGGQVRIRGNAGKVGETLLG